MAKGKRRRKKKCRTICFSRKRNGEFGKGKCLKRRRRKKSSHRSKARKHSFSPRKHPRKANGEFKSKGGSKKKSRKRKKSSHRSKKRRSYREGTYYNLSTRRVQKRGIGPSGTG